MRGPPVGDARIAAIVAANSRVWQVRTSATPGLTRRSSVGVAAALPGWLFAPWPAAVATDAPNIRVRVLELGTIIWELDVVWRPDLGRANGCTLEIKGYVDDQVKRAALQGGEIDMVVADLPWLSFPMPGAWWIVGNRRVPWSSIGAAACRCGGGLDVSSLRRIVRGLQRSSPTGTASRSRRSGHRSCC
jgi:hypothetical protein